MLDIPFLTLLSSVVYAAQVSSSQRGIVAGQLAKWDWLAV
jgi:hypothetical protein